MTISVQRLEGNPIISLGETPSTRENINGPSLIIAPPWLEKPLARYYLYFAHHNGQFIRLATADLLEGPWVVYEPGTLGLAASHFFTEGKRSHVASPDVHIDTANQTVRMYFHGKQNERGEQYTRVAISSDGLRFEALPELLGPPYFRVFHHDGWWYALAAPDVLYRSLDGLSKFEEGPAVFDPTLRVRHSAVIVRNDELIVFWTQKGDRPERILCSRIALGADWRSWKAGASEEVLEPERSWEGSDLPLAESAGGKISKPVRELRDPAIFCERDRTFLLYAVAGESGIAIAELNLARPYEPS
jgi:hypothetical protein